MTVIHICHAERCTVSVPPKMFMCKRHWFMVPRDLRLKVWFHYRPGQEIAKDPTLEYLKIAREAIAVVAAKETTR